MDYPGLSISDLSPAFARPSRDSRLSNIYIYRFSTLKLAQYLSEHTCRGESAPIILENSYHLKLLRIGSLRAHLPRRKRSDYPENSYSETASGSQNSSVQVNHETAPTLLEHVN